MTAPNMFGAVRKFYPCLGIGKLICVDEKNGAQCGYLSAKVT